MDKYFSEIEEKINTKEDFLFYLKQIDLMKGSVLKFSDALFMDKENNESLNDIGVVLARMEREDERFRSANEKISFLSSLKERLLTAPQIRIEVAFPFSREAIFRMKKWLESNLGKSVILDIVVKPNLIGGAVIEFDGVRKDFSVLKRVENLEIKIPQ